MTICCFGGVFFFFCLYEGWVGHLSLGALRGTERKQADAAVGKRGGLGRLQNSLAGPGACRPSKYMD